MAAKIEKLERTYTIPLRKEYLKVPYYLRSKKALATVKKFLTRHMKSDQIKIGVEINEAIWKRSSSNPPHKIKVNVTKDEKGVVKAELFGKEEKKEKKAKGKAEAKKASQ